MIYILSEKKYDGAVNLPSIMIKYHTKEIDLRGYDALVFSSKNGVNAIDMINPAWRDIPAYSIGSATSQAIEDLGGRVVYSARSSYGDDFAEEIKARLSGKRVLFLRAKVVTSSLNRILKDAGVLLEEEVVYETLCTPCKDLQKPSQGAIMIFSSPSTIACFFRCFAWEESYQAVVIGYKTASFMPKNVPFLQADKQTIPSCIQLAQKLSKKPL